MVTVWMHKRTNFYYACKHRKLVDGHRCIYKRQTEPDNRGKKQACLKAPYHRRVPVMRCLFLYAYTIKPPAKLVVPLTALALDKKTSNDIISVGPKPHYI